MHIGYHVYIWEMMILLHQYISLFRLHRNFGFRIFRYRIISSYPLRGFWARQFSWFCNDDRETAKYRWTFERSIGINVPRLIRTFRCLRPQHVTRWISWPVARSTGHLTVAHYCVGKIQTKLPLGPMLIIEWRRAKL